ncbi:MAG: phosphoglycerate dehydrogenase, partial [Verrucomicrobiota bacterium]
MKVLVADKISPKGIELLKQQEGCEVVVSWETLADWKAAPEQVKELIADCDAVAVRSETKITAEIIAAAPKLKAIGRAGVGVDNIDIEAATERGIIVMNTPGGNTIATAELTFTHMLCGTRPIAQANEAMRGGRWDRKLYSGMELNGKTLGVCGLGRIGAEVSKRAIAFNMTVLAYDPFLTESRANALGLNKVDSLDEIFTQADYITVHMPLTDQTKHMIDEAAIAMMKDGVRLFNVARGGIIKEDALIEAVKSGKVAAAGLDVYESEPLADDSELRGLEQVVTTPHLGASTKEAQESVGVEIAEQLAEVLAGKPARNAINMPSVDAKTLEALKPYLDLGAALGSFVQQLSPPNVEKLRITYTGKIVELDAMPLTRSILRGYLRKISDNANDVNAPKKLQELGIELETTKSNQDSDYTELVEVQAICGDGKTRTACGTLFGKHQTPRIVRVDGHGVEVNTTGTLLAIKNKDVPGIVGFL